MNELVIEAKTENIDAVLNFIYEKLGNCPEKTKNQISVVTDEIFSNVANYAYNPGVGNVSIRVTVDEEVSIEFEDGGIAFNPLNAADPDISLGAEERGIGGLGIHIVKNIMDSVDYRRDGNKNIITVKKKL
ncbi:MAG: ATP-binding protein [Defluviitaleaceae bacterium]|nr:ATP-binding protein [Defluviitaleaceae bacterium]